MSKPLWIPCTRLEALPTVEQLGRLAPLTHQIILLVPEVDVEAQSRVSQMMKQLQLEMLNHHVSGRMFRSNAFVQDESAAHLLAEVLHRPAAEFVTIDPGYCLFITKLIQEAAVLGIADTITDAAHLFRTIATDLMTRLANHLDVSIEAFENPLFRLQYKRQIPQPRGEFEDGWVFWFHGYECQFRHRMTRQVLDIKLGCRNEFGLLDPYFLMRFVATTEGFNEIDAVLQGKYELYADALSVLEKHGYLKRVHYEPDASAPVATDR